MEEIRGRINTTGERSAKESHMNYIEYSAKQRARKWDGSIGRQESSKLRQRRMAAMASVREWIRQEQNKIGTGTNLEDQ